MATKILKRNLISLVWPSNTCYSSLISGIPKGVTLDLKAGTWTFQEQTQKIGDSRNPCTEGLNYPIGVFDRTKIKHLQQLQEEIEWVQNRNRPTGLYD